MTNESTASLRSQVCEAISNARRLALAELAPAGEAPSPAGEEPAASSDAPVTVERPADPSFGDFASNIALKLAKPYRRAPMDIAKAIAAHVVTTASDPASPISSVEVAPPGFLNVRVADGRLAATTARILREPATWGRIVAARPEHINVEFVSANPTGPLHIGNARGAFTGDLLCRVLTAAGHKVEREYYFNVFGCQG